MINEEVLSEKLKYLITMNAKGKQFEIINITVEFEYIDQLHKKLHRYDVDIKVDYLGAIDFELGNCLDDIRRMVDKLGEIVSEYVITEDGKIVANSNNSKTWVSEPLIFNMEFVADTTHLFELGYAFYIQRD